MRNLRALYTFFERARQFANIRSPGGHFGKWLLSKSNHGNCDFSVSTPNRSGLFLVDICLNGQLHFLGLIIKIELKDKTLTIDMYDRLGFQELCIPLEHLTNLILPRQADDNIHFVIEDERLVEKSVNLNRQTSRSNYVPRITTLTGESCRAHL